MSNLVVKRTHKKWFRLIEEKISVEIDLKKQLLRGYVEFTVEILRIEYRQHEVKINCRQCAISKTEVNGIESKYEQRNFLEQIVPDSEPGISYQVYDEYYRASMSASDDGELIVYVPDQVINTYRELSVNQKTAPQMKVKVFYQLVIPKGGFYFVYPNPSFKDRTPHAFTYSQFHGARTWFPCFDSLTDACTFEMHFTVDEKLTVIASGENYQTIHQDERKTYYYKVDTPVTAQNIGFCVGPFYHIYDSKYSNVSFYCLPSYENELKHTISFFSQVISFLEEFIGSPLPFKQYKQVFVEEPYSEICSTASMSILNSELLYDKTIIDQTYKTRYKLAFACAMQYFGMFIGPKVWEDLWIFYGLAGYLAGLFIQKIHGNNEYRYGLLKNVEKICANDFQPLSFSSYSHPCEFFISKTFQTKSAFIFYMLEQKMGLEPLRNVISYLVSPTEGLVARFVTIKKLVKIIKRIATIELKNFGFLDRWVYCKGCPILTVGLNFNKKKQIIELALRQDSGRISHQLLVRVHESDNQEHDHTINFDDEIQTFDFPCHSKIKKPRKKKQKDAEENAAPEEEKDKEKTPIDSQNPISWVRVDPELEFLRQINLKFSERLLLNQLQQEMTVYSQYEALHALEPYIGSKKTLDALENTLINEKLFYKIRIEAAFILAKSPIDGCEKLIQYFRNKYSKDSFLKPNNFSNFVDYFIQKGIVDALGTTQDKSFASPVNFRFLLDILKHNDNSQNSYSDNFYLASTLVSIGNVHFSNEDTLKLMKQLERYLHLDKLIPSYHKTITVACLKTMQELQATKKIPIDYSVFRDFLKYGNFIKVRIVALSSLCRLGLHSNLEYIIDILEKEPDHRFKMKAFQVLATTPKGMSDNQYVSLFQTSNNLKLLEFLWNQLNSIESAFHPFYRCTMEKFWFKIWGPDHPKIAPRDGRTIFKKRVLQPPPSRKRKSETIPIQFTATRLPSNQPATVESPKPITVVIKKPKSNPKPSPSPQISELSSKSPPSSLSNPIPSSPLFSPQVSLVPSSEVKTEETSQQDNNITSPRSTKPRLKIILNKNQSSDNLLAATNANTNENK